jgi:hypothetical protein
MIAKELGYLSKDETENLLALASGAGRGLSGLINSLHSNAA